MSSSTVLGPVFTLVTSNDTPLYPGMNSGTENPRGVKHPDPVPGRNHRFGYVDALPSGIVVNRNTTITWENNNTNHP